MHAAAVMSSGYVTYVHASRQTCISGEGGGGEEEHGTGDVAFGSGLFVKSWGVA